MILPTRASTATSFPGPFPWLGWGPGNEVASIASYFQSKPGNTNIEIWPKPLSMAATSRVIRCCVRYWPDRGLVFKCRSLAFIVCNTIGLFWSRDILLDKTKA